MDGMVELEIGWVRWRCAIWLDEFNDWMNEMTIVTYNGNFRKLCYICANAIYTITKSYVTHLHKNVSLIRKKCYGRMYNFHKISYFEVTESSNRSITIILRWLKNQYFPIYFRTYSISVRISDLNMKQLMHVRMHICVSL